MSVPPILDNAAMSDHDNAVRDAPGAGTDPLARLRGQLLTRWARFPPDRDAELDALLGDVLQQAAASEAEILTVMDPAARPQRLRLAHVVDAVDLDSFYHNEWAELSISSDGRCFLVYRRRDGGDYAVTWSTATAVPAALMQALPDVLALAMLEGDGAEG